MTTTTLNDVIHIKDDLAKEVARRADSLGALVKDNPFVALGIGLGVGYLIARLVHR